MLLHPGSWEPAQSSERGARRALRRAARRHAAPETHAAVLELTTGVHSGVEQSIAELAALRARLAAELDAMGLAVAAAGMHPLAVAAQTRISTATRYREIDASMRMLTRREPTMALHVHVGVPDPEDAVRVMTGLRRTAPALIALAANSPFSQGRDGGFASERTMVFREFPRTGLPRVFDDYADYVDTLDGLVASGAIDDPSFMWWDVRLQPALGTVEVRLMDAQTTVGETAALVALVQALARLELEDDPSPPTPSPEVLAENCFRAARDGMDARLVDTGSRRLVPVRDTVEGLLVRARPHARVLGCSEAFERVLLLSIGSGADRQRALADRHGRLDHVVAALAGLFVPDATRTPPGRSGSCVAGWRTPDLPSC